MSQEQPEHVGAEHEGVAHDDTDAPPAYVPSNTPPPQTGIVVLDELVTEVAGLDDVDVAEHAAVYERAHGTMRAVLDGREET